MAFDWGTTKPAAAPATSGGAFSWGSGTTAMPVATSKGPVASSTPSAPAIPTVKPVDTSNAFSKLLTSVPAAPKVTLASGSTPALLATPKADENPFNIKPSTTDVVGRNETLTSDKRSPIAKAIDSVKEFFTNDSERDTTAMGVQNLIVDKNLTDIGKQLGLDAEFPLNPDQDATTAKYYQDKQISTYLRDNWNSVKKTLQNPDDLPEHPEMLGPMFKDVQKNLDAYTKELGLRSEPTNTEIVSTVLQGAVAAALIQPSIAGVIGLSAFVALGAVEQKFLGATVADKITDAFGGNDNTRLALNLVEMFAEGAILHQVALKAPKLAENWTKETTTRYLPGKTITLDSAKVKDLFQTGKLTTAEEKQMYNDLYKETGRTSAQLKADIQNGVQIQVPPEKLVLLVDRPWFAKVKSALSTTNKFLGQPEILPSSKVLGRSSQGSFAKASESRPNYLLGEGLETTRVQMKVLQDEIKERLGRDGELATHQALMKNLGFDTRMADDIIQQVKAANTPEEFKALSDALLKEIAPEAYLADGELPVIDAGRPARSALPTIQINGEPKGKQRLGKLTVEPIEEMKIPAAAKPKQPILEPEKPIEKITEPEKPAVAAETPKEKIAGPPKEKSIREPERQIPKLTERIQEKLGETFDDVPEYEGMDMKEQAKAAGELISGDYEKAKRIAMGLEKPDGSLRVGSVFKAVEMKAIADGDKETLRDLAHSKTTRAATSYGQEIKAFDGRDPYSPVDAIARIDQALETKAKKRLPKGKTLANAKTAIKTEISKKIRERATKESWASFVDSIAC